MKKLLLAVLMVFCFVPVVHAAIITDTYYFSEQFFGIDGWPLGNHYPQSGHDKPESGGFPLLIRSHVHLMAFPVISGSKSSHCNENVSGSLNISLPSSWTYSLGSNISHSALSLSKIRVQGVLAKIH